jgi:large subunit ribosomal protein L17
MMRNLAISLIEHEVIKTTVEKGKELRRFLEPLITRAKEDTLHNRRTVLSNLNSKDATSKLFSDLGPRFKETNGGYLRVIKAGFRAGDKADISYVELTIRNQDQETKSDNAIVEEFTPETPNTTPETKTEETVVKESAPKKTAEKKAEPKKAASKKTAEKKAEPKKAASKKTAEKKAEPKKAAPKKTAEKKAEPKKAAPKKTAEKKAASKPAVKKPAEKKEEEKKSWWSKFLN